MKCWLVACMAPRPTQPMTKMPATTTTPRRPSQGSVGVGSKASTIAMGTQMLHTVCRARL